MTRCAYSDHTGQCPNEATRRVDSRALGRADAALDVCAEHYQVVKTLWQQQADELAELEASRGWGKEPPA